MNKGNSQATAKDYLTLAREMNAIAGKTLKLETRDAEPIAGKISLGLSLQAAELAGKSVLRTLGHSVEDIKQKYRNHKLLTLLRDVEQEIRGRPEEKFRRYHHFLSWAPTIDGMKYWTTVGAYFELHFARGPTAYPRSYFYPDDYPDEGGFTRPEPIQVVFFLVEYLIETAENLVALTEQD
ncbi:MAG: hypothetical protein ACREVE_17245 [Gammaproteobacteria bacterium]